MIKKIFLRACMVFALLAYLAVAAEATGYTLRTLSSGTAVSSGDLFASRQGSDTSDKSVTAAQLKTFMATTSLASLTTNVLFDANNNINLGLATAEHAGATYNTFVGNITGHPSGSTNQTTANTGVGSLALATLTGGQYNTAVGSTAENALTSGVDNVAVGYGTLGDMTTDGQNTAIGDNALAVQNTAGSSANNVAVGFNAGFTVPRCTTCTNSTFLGANTSGSAATTANETVIGEGAVGLGANQTVIGNSSVTNTTVPAGSFTLGNASTHAGQATCWTTSGQIGYCTSAVGVGGACTCTGL